MDLLKEVGRDGIVQPTQQSQKLTIGGISKSYQVYKIRLDKLRYNSQNDRIATWVSQYKAEHAGILPDETDIESYNSIIESFIVKSNEKAIKSTTENIRDNEQKIPAVVLSDGLVVDGNRRFTCLRRLAQENPRFNWLEAVILPEEIVKDQKAIKLLELAIQHGEESKIDYNPVERLVGIYNDIIHDKLLTEEEYAKTTNTTTPEIKKLVQQAGYMIDFLDFINADGQFHLARELDISGPLLELPMIMKVCTDENEEELVKNCVFANMVVEPAGDITRFVRKFKKILKSPIAPEFIEKETALTEEVIDRLASIKTMTKDAIRDGFRNDQDLINRFAETMDIEEKKASGVKVLSTPLDNMLQASELLDNVDVAILKHLSNEDIKRTIRVLNDIESKIEQIRDSAVKDEGWNEA
jgi:hypothetical protein